MFGGNAFCWGECVVRVEGCFRHSVCVQAYKRARVVPLAMAHAKVQLQKTAANAARGSKAPSSFFTTTEIFEAGAGVPGPEWVMVDMYMPGSVNTRGPPGFPRARSEGVMAEGPRTLRRRNGRGHNQGPPNAVAACSIA